VTGSVAEDDAVENAISIADDIVLKAAIGETWPTHLSSMDNVTNTWIA
ncbi:uncharacterized protein METZ01_LOCUS344346, partial [marine metagenome]